MSLTIKKGPSLPPKKPRKKHSEYQDWAVLRDEWIVGQLIGGLRAMTLTDFALSKNLAVSTVQNKASSMKWRAELDVRRKANDDVVTRELAERSEKAVAEVQQLYVGREAAIRGRHAAIAKGLQAKAMQRLSALEAKDLTVKEALTMLQLGLVEERFATGLDEQYKPPQEDQGAHPEYKTLTQQNNNHKRVQEVALALMRKLQDKGIEDATILQAVGLEGSQSDSSSQEGGR